MQHPPAQRALLGPALAVALALVALPASSRAADQIGGPTPVTPVLEPTLEEQINQPRLRLAVGLHVGAGAIGSGLGGGLGLAVDAGVQLGDAYAVYLQARASTVVLSTYLSAAAIFEWSPVRFFSLGTGVVAGYANGEGRAGARLVAGEIGVPLVVAFNVQVGARTAAPRNAFRIALEGAFYPPVFIGNLGGYGGLTFAYLRN